MHYASPLLRESNAKNAKKNLAMFSDNCSVRADGLCIGSPRLVGGWKVGNSDMQELFLHHTVVALSKQVLTMVSASKKTHFEYSVSFQQFNLVNVTPSSGLSSKARFASS